MTFPLSECCGNYKHAPHDFCQLCPIMGRRHRALYIDHDLSIVKFPDDGQTEGDRGISPAENEAPYQPTAREWADSMEGGQRMTPEGLAAEVRVLRKLRRDGWRITAADVVEVAITGTHENAALASAVLQELDAERERP